jgi:hypothetical protein
VSTENSLCFGGKAPGIVQARISENDVEVGSLSCEMVLSKLCYRYIYTKRIVLGGM